MGSVDFFSYSLATLLDCSCFFRYLLVKLLCSPWYKKNIDCSNFILHLFIFYYCLFLAPIHQYNFYVALRLIVLQLWV